MAGSTTTERSGPTRELLIDAAEALIDAESIDFATVARITAAAGQRNAAAVHYHFGGRDGLLAALVERHHAALDEARVLRLAAIEREHATVHQVVEIIIDPMIECLSTPAGRAFLAVQAERFVGEPTGTDMAASMRGVVDLLADLVPPASIGISAERARLAATLVNIRLGQQAIDHDPTHGAVELRATLVAAVTATLCCEPETT